MFYGDLRLSIFNFLRKWSSEPNFIWYWWENKHSRFCISHPSVSVNWSYHFWHSAIIVYSSLELIIFWLFPQACSYIILTFSNFGMKILISDLSFIFLLILVIFLIAIISIPSPFSHFWRILISTQCLSLQLVVIEVDLPTLHFYFESIQSSSLVIFTFLYFLSTPSHFFISKSLFP